MKIYALNIFETLPNLTPSVTALGHFDGVHLGHQSIIETALSWGHAVGYPTTILTFEPPAQIYFEQSNFFRLHTPQQKYEKLEALGIDCVIALSFDEHLEHLKAEDFLAYLKALSIRGIVVGENFRFGFQREGTAEWLRSHWGSDWVQIAPCVHYEKEVVSSSRVRQLLRHNRVADVKPMLGTYYTYRGTVVPGRQCGKKLGFPTANIPIPDHFPLRGVFFVIATLEEKTYPGVANIGIRPTHGLSSVWLEVHLLERMPDLYGYTLDLAFVQYLRAETKFETLEDLRQQIVTDVQQAQAFYREICHDG